MKSNKLKIIIVCSIIIGLATGLSFSPNLKIWHPEICINNSCFNIEIASTPKHHAQWLMNVKYLAAESGMLFVFDKEDTYSFWMKNTLIPLDMIWIDQNHTIVDIQTATPCITKQCETYWGKERASYVLEINGGLSKKLWISKGQKVQIKY